MKAAQLFDVAGLATVVTGGASGIGNAYAEVMADNGARVTILDIDAKGAEQEVARLRARGGEARAEIADVTDRKAMRAAFDATAAHYGGRLDVVYANAGIDPGPGFMGMDGQRNPAAAFENIPDEMWDRGIATNLTSIFTTIRAAIPHMKPHKSGRIIVTTSVAAIRPEPIVGMPYMPAKAGAAHLVRQAAIELAKYNILVNAIAPGPFITNIAGGHMRNPAARAAFEKLTPMHRLASTEEIQGLALYLASPASKYVTGAQYVIDGGVMLGFAD